MKKQKLSLRQVEKALNLKAETPANVLMVLPEQVDSNLLGLKIVSQALNQGKPSVFVSTEKSTEELKLLGMKNGISLARFEEKNFLYWIDCYSLQAGKKVQSTPSVERVASQLDLTNLSVAISKAQKNFYSFRQYYKVLESISISPLQTQDFFLKADHRIYFDSLSTLLQFNGLKAIERFLTVQLQKIKKANGSSLFTLRKKECQKEIKQIDALMDSVVELVV